jgi:DNA-binding transcriptional ArsR family regulator
MSATRTDPRVRALKALAHPARLRLVEALGRGERRVLDLRKLVGLDLSTVSRHLKLLADAGLLASRREGRKVVYSLAAPCVLDYLNCLDAVLAGKSCRVVVSRGGCRP